MEAATELIASSMVAAKGLSLPGALEATTGWPVAVIDAEERAPPPLAEDGSLCDPSQVGALVQKAIVCEEDFAERLDCEIFMGGTNGLEVEDLWKALTELLMDLPSYKKQFPDLSLPLINIRMANGPYAFARLANPRLASTAVVIGEMFIRSRKVQLKRPTHCELSQKSAPPLDVISWESPFESIGPVKRRTSGGRRNRGVPLLGCLAMFCSCPKVCSSSLHPQRRRWRNRGQRKSSRTLRKSRRLMNSEEATGLIDELNISKGT